MANPEYRRAHRRRCNPYHRKPSSLAFCSAPPPTNTALAHQCPLDPRPLVEAQVLLPTVPRKIDAQPLGLLQMGQTRALPLAQAFKVPIRHRALHVSGNSAAVESFAASDHGGKYGVAGVLTAFRLKVLGNLL